MLGRSAAAAGGITARERSRPLDARPWSGTHNRTRNRRGRFYWRRARRSVRVNPVGVYRSGTRVCGMCDSEVKGVRMRGGGMRSDGIGEAGVSWRYLD